MYLSFHMPMFGSLNVDSYQVECPACPRGKEHGVNDWETKDISTCNPGDRFRCLRCGSTVAIMWGLEEPDHLSNWLNAEHCPHRLCKRKRIEIRSARENLNSESPQLQGEQQ